jgi:hypothetical protein
VKRSFYQRWKSNAEKTIPIKSKAAYKKLNKDRGKINLHCGEKYRDYFSHKGSWLM